MVLRSPGPATPGGPSWPPPPLPADVPPPPFISEIRGPRTTGMLRAKAATTTVTPAIRRAGRAQGVGVASHAQARRAQPGCALTPVPPARADDVRCPPARHRRERAASAPATSTTTYEYSTLSRLPAALPPVARPERARATAGSQRVTISHPMSTHSARSNDTCLRSHGCATRSRIRVRPSPDGSMGSTIACNARRTMSS